MKLNDPLGPEPRSKSLEQPKEQDRGRCSSNVILQRLH